MTDTAEIMQELESLGSEQTVKTYRRHGADGPMYGVKIGDLKKIVKKVKGNQQLASDLWETGNSDAMYLAALAADGKQMTRKQLNAWAGSAWWHMLSEYAVPFVAAEHKDAFAIARKWIDSKKEAVACSGWCTYATALSVRPDAELNLPEIEQLLSKIENEIDQAPDRIRYCMNNFVICVGGYVKPLLSQAKQTARRLGTVNIDMGETACRVPHAADSIRKIESLKRVGIKRKTTKC